MHCRQGEQECCYLVKSRWEQLALMDEHSNAHGVMGSHAHHICLRKAGYMTARHGSRKSDLGGHEHLPVEAHLGTKELRPKMPAGRA